MKMLNNKHFTILPKITGERGQKILSVILTLIALCLFGLFAINPTLSTIAKLRKEIEDYEIINQKLGDKISALNSLQQDYSRLEDKIPSVLESIPKSPTVPFFIGQVQAVAKKSNLSVELQNSQVDLFKEGNLEKYHKYSFSFTGDGTYESITTFIESITNMQRVVGMDIATINVAEAEDKTLRINFQGVAYYKD